MRRVRSRHPFPVLVVLGSGLIAAMPSVVVGAAPTPTGPATSIGPSAGVAAASTAPSSQPLMLTVNDAGLSVVVTADRSAVEPGGIVRMVVSIRNERPVPVVLADGCPAAMAASVPVPQGRPGRTWDGVAAEFKEFALTEGDAPGGGPALAPETIEGRATECPSDDLGLMLQPGDSVSTHLRWRARIVKGVDVAPGEIPFDVVILHDPSGAPPSRAPDAQGPMSSWTKTYEELTVHGTLIVAGTPPTVVTAEEAIDGLLADRRFSTWLAERPSSTWSQSNVFLESLPRPQGIVPAGASWEIDLFREHGVPRDWAIGFVDAATGELRSVSFCDSPCDR